MEKDLLSIIGSTKYPLEAFDFVNRGLEYTIGRIHGKRDPDADAEPADRHISGQQLCYGLRDYAISQYGLLARTVLQHWHIHSCADFGHIVFAMVAADIMRKTSGDSIEDFTGVFNFAAAFSPAVQLSENS